MSIYAKFEPEAKIGIGQWLETCMGTYRVVDAKTGEVVQEGKVVHPECLQCGNYLTPGGYGDEGVILHCHKCGTQRAA